MNKVIAGDYAGQGIMKSWKTVQITLPMFKTVKINKDNVAEYEVLNETARTSSASAVGRATLGSLFLGPVGAAAALGAKQKGAYWVAVQFKDGKRSLLEVDDNLFRAITIALF